MYPLYHIYTTVHLVFTVVNILGGDTVLASLNAKNTSAISSEKLIGEKQNSLGPAPSLDPDRRNFDEAAGSSGFETAHLVHRGELGVVQALIGISALDNNVALVELESDDTVDSLLRCGDGGSDEFTLGGEEETVVEDLRELGGNELVSEGSDVSVEGQTFEVHVGSSEDGSSGRLVASSRLDTDKSVLDNVDSADTVPPSKSVEGKENVHRVGHSVAVSRESNLDGETLGELNMNSLGSIGSLLGGDSKLPHVIGGSLVGVLKDTGLVRDVEEVLVYTCYQRG